VSGFIRHAGIRMSYFGVPFKGSANLGRPIMGPKLMSPLHRQGCQHQQAEQPNCKLNKAASMMESARLHCRYTNKLRRNSQKLKGKSFTAGWLYRRRLLQVRRASSALSFKRVSSLAIQLALIDVDT
jgi:hypothetical protein